MTTAQQWALVALLFGAAGWFLFLLALFGSRRHATRRVTLPRELPVRQRLLVSATEQQLWQWLQRVFPDHHVLVKVPVARFTMPHDPQAGAQWFSLLNSVYCVFTICDDAGRVIGCLDVLEPHRLSRGNIRLKQTLLEHCGIGYWALAPDDMPSPEALQAEFLDTAPLGTMRRQPEREADDLQAAHDSLIDAISRRRRSRRPRRRDAAAHRPPDSGFDSWTQPDSLFGPLAPDPELPAAESAGLSHPRR